MHAVRCVHTLTGFDVFVPSAQVRIINFVWKSEDYYLCLELCNCDKRLHGDCMGNGAKAGRPLPDVCFVFLCMAKYIPWSSTAYTGTVPDVWIFPFAWRGT